MGGISLITIYDRKFRHNRPEEGLPKMITYISPKNMAAEDNHLYFAYKSPLGLFQKQKSYKAENLFFPYLLLNKVKITQEGSSWISYANWIILFSFIL